MNTQESQAEWTPPATIEEAETMRLDLVNQLNAIESQLSARKGERDDDGRFAMSAKDYFDWRSRAINAKRFTLAKLKRLNLWIKQTRRERTADRAKSLGVDPTSPDSMLMAMANLIQKLRSDGVDLDQHEIDLVDAVKSYLISTTGSTNHVSAKVKGAPKS